MNLNRFATLLMSVLGMGSSLASAQSLTTAFIYQGELLSGGAPTSGPHDLRFRLFDSISGGGQVGTAICLDNVSVAAGRLSVSLDFGAAFAGQQRFLEIEVRADTGLNCGSAVDFVLLEPRQAITAAPNALFALTAAQFGGQPASFYQNASNLTSGTLSAARLPLPLALSGTNEAHIIQGVNDSTTLGASAVYGWSATATGTAYGVRGRSDSVSGRAFYGEATAATGFTYGGQFESSSTIGTGVYGRHSASSGVGQGVLGWSNSTQGRAVFGFVPAGTGPTYGVVGQSSSTSGTGVQGLATHPDGLTYGVHGRSDSFNGQGVFGEATRDVGTNYGVYGQSASNDGRGVFGLAVASAGVTYGGVFQSYSNGGRGVRGYCSSLTGFTYAVFGESDSDNGRGVYGFADGTGSGNYGVYGRSVNGVSVYANGSSVATGTKSFRIDHPADPANKYLLHYAAESPEVINFYSGKTVLDGAGEAVVELPQYFAMINRDPRYSVTAMGAAMPNLHIAEEIADDALNIGAQAEPGEVVPACWFRIAGGAPNGKVSWRVEAVRSDAWVRAHGAPIEVEKPEFERGTYQHPELYGQPAEKGLSLDATRQEPQPNHAAPRT